MAALNTRDPAKRATAMEVFIAWYPGSALRLEAHEQAMAAWQAANQPDKAGFIAGKLLQIDPGNLHALAYRVYAARTKVMQGDASGVTSMVAAAEQGLAALPTWPKRPSLSDEAHALAKKQMSAVFNGALGYAALHAKDYDKARRFYREAVAAEPDNLQDVYQ